MRDVFSRSQIKKDMSNLEILVHLGWKLRKRLGIPLRQPLLDFAYGGTLFLYKKEQYIGLLARALNCWYCGGEKDTEQEMDNLYNNQDWYYGFEIGPPKSSTNETWEVEFEGEGKKWVALNLIMPDWLKEIGDRRKKERQEIFAKKKESLSTTT